jgi:hypothetical protein
MEAHPRSVMFTLEPHTQRKQAIKKSKGHYSIQLYCIPTNNERRLQHDLKEESSPSTYKAVASWWDDMLIN